MNNYFRRKNRSLILNEIPSTVDGLGLYRFFRVYHPVIEADVNIEILKEDENYHIIEKYMDKLVCGYLGNESRSADKIHITGKRELFELMGLNSCAYEIADAFFTDLVDIGHFEVTDHGIKPLEPAFRSVKLDKKVQASTVREKKLLDAFSLSLMPGDFYELASFTISPETVDTSDVEVTTSAWLQTMSVEDRTAADINEIISRKDYTNEDLTALCLPQGTSHMTLSFGEQPSVLFYPYYLAIYTDGTNIRYECYRPDDGRPIIGLGDFYTTAHYTQVLSTITALVESGCTLTVNNPVFSEFHIKENGVPSAQNGVTVRYDGNYEWRITEPQLAFMLGDGFNRTACKKIADNDIDCLTNFEAGRLVYIIKTERQKQLLQACVKSPQQREQLFYQYLNPEGEN